MNNYGLIIKPKAPEDYVHQLGASKIHKKVHRADGQWIMDIPIGEVQQKNGVETMSCVSFWTENALEIIESVKYGTLSNHSDRYLAIASETTSQGNDPKNVAQTFRDKGAIPEHLLPFENVHSFDEYHSPKPLPKSLTNEGKKWLTKWEVGYEWVTPTPENIMDELRYGPLGVAVEAWKQDEKGYYYGGENPNHWTGLIGYIKDQYWIGYDSYPETSGSYLKLLRWDYKFAMAMSYSLNKKKEPEDKSFWSFLNWAFSRFKNPRTS